MSLIRRAGSRAALIGVASLRRGVARRMQPVGRTDTPCWPDPRPGEPGAVGDRVEFQGGR